MRLLFAIPLIFIGAFLVGLTIDNIGDIGNTALNIIGVGVILVAVIGGKGKKEKQKHS